MDDQTQPFARPTGSFVYSQHDVYSSYPLSEPAMMLVKSVLRLRGQCWRYLTSEPVTAFHSSHAGQTPDRLVHVRSAGAARSTQQNARPSAAGLLQSKSTRRIASLRRSSKLYGGKHPSWSTSLADSKCFTGLDSRTASDLHLLLVCSLMQTNSGEEKTHWGSSDL